MKKILSLFVISALACEPVVVHAAQQQLLAGAPSEATASLDFATLEGIPAEALSADEMALVEGKQFRRIVRAARAVGRGARAGARAVGRAASAVGRASARAFREAPGVAGFVVVVAAGLVLVIAGGGRFEVRPLNPPPLPSSGGVPIPPPGTPPGTIIIE